MSLKRSKMGSSVCRVCGKQKKILLCRNETTPMIKDTQGRYKEVKKQSVNLTNSHVMLTVHLAGCTNHARTFFFKLSNVPEKFVKSKVDILKRILVLLAT